MSSLVAFLAIEESSPPTLRRLPVDQRLEAWHGALSPTPRCSSPVASTGLGLAIAKRLLARSNYRLVLTARESSLSRFSAAGLEEGDRLWLRPLDVQSRDERFAVVSEVEQKLGGVDVLINNAGVAYRSVVEHAREQERLEQMGVNFRAPMAMTNLVLPGMRERRTGRIINVSSVGGMMAMPTMALYSASKFALEGASEALWYEVRPWNIWVTLVEPGFINSEGFLHTLYTERSSSSSIRMEAAYHMHYAHMGSFIEKLMRRSAATPEVVARRVHKVIKSRRPPLRLQATLDARFFSLLRRLVPQRIYHEILYRALPGSEQVGQESAAARF